MLCMYFAYKLTKNSIKAANVTTIAMKMCGPNLFTITTQGNKKKQKEHIPSFFPRFNELRFGWKKTKECGPYRG